jgi:hypothetical protein
VLNKHRQLDIPEVGLGVRQTQTLGYTRGGINFYTNRDTWICQRWDQVLDKHRHLVIPEVGLGVRQTQTIGYTRGRARC